MKAGLDSEFLATKMLACKQLSSFLPFDGLALFERALADPEPSVQGEALVRLADRRPPEAKPVLERYVGRAKEAHLKQIAEQTLASLG